MYLLEDVINHEGESVKEMWHIVGKEFEAQEVEVGKVAKLKNMTDAHMYHRVERTSIVSKVVDTFRELEIFTRDSIYILRKVV